MATAIGPPRNTGLTPESGGDGGLREHGRPPVRAGIIGTGFMGEVHARAIRAAGGTLAAVVSSSPASAVAGARRLHAERAAADALDLIADPDINVIHICTPNYLHADLARAVLREKKHVVCEKPLAINLGDAEDLVRRAHAAGRVAAVPFVYRFYPSVREARARVSNGNSGALGVIHGSYLQDWLSTDRDTNWRVYAHLGGRSRTFADIGVHWCDLVEFVSGHRIEALCARLSTTVERSGNMDDFGGASIRATEDAATLIFETDRGAIGSLVVSQVSPGRKNRLWASLDGANTSMSFDLERPDNLWVGGRQSNTVVVRGADGASEQSQRYTLVPAGHPQGYQDCFNAFVADVYTAISGEAVDGLPTFADGYRSALLTQAVLQSAHTRAWVEVHAPANLPSGAGRR